MNINDIILEDIDITFGEFIVKIILSDKYKYSNINSIFYPANWEINSQIEKLGLIINKQDLKYLQKKLRKDFIKNYFRLNNISNNEKEIYKNIIKNLNWEHDNEDVEDVEYEENEDF